MPLVKASELNELLTCRLCHGYFIDATAITECLHTFCKSCLVSYLKVQNTCPICKLLIHQSHPLNFIRQDRTLQDLVYKLIPGIKQNETCRKERFFKDRGLPVPEASPQGDEDRLACPHDHQSALGYQDNGFSIDEPPIRRDDEQIAVCLEYDSSKDPKRKLKPLKLKYLKCSSYATVGHLKKFISKKLNLCGNGEIDVMYNNEVLGKDHTLKFLIVTRWKLQAKPLMLHYRPKMTLS